MTSKERVLCAAKMQKTDRCPRDFHACSYVLEKLYQYSGLSRYRDLIDQLHSDIVDIRGVVDPIWVAPFPREITRQDGSVQDYLGFIKKTQQTVFGPLSEHSDYLLAECLDTDEMKALYQFPKVEWFDFSTMSQRLDEYKDLAVMASGASVFQHPTLLRRMDMLLCDMLTDPENAEYIMDGYTNFYCDYYRAMFEACPGKIDILRIADDLGMQDRPLISMDMFKRFVEPRVKKLCDLAHRFGVLVMFHSCGSIFHFIQPLLEAGVDILDPLQPNAKDMDPQNLYTHFAGKVCFHGSIDTQYTLPNGTPEDVRCQVREHASIFRQPGSGFIASPAHTLQPDVPVENIVALYDELDHLE